ncbi:tyrosine-type recombinase/integrase [Alkalicoccus chagannorensis]|uniref:tyrosine-type recombinase/integrase n=1 Tax=Alkalicoccus chagannorensis TaxID=427072 RepID=UPI00047BCC01|nr:tyrosine-type recombinase/integrase [Alkalicoccus chagannorensis]
MHSEFHRQIDDYMLYCQSRGLTRKSMSSYEQALRLFAEWAANEKKIDRAEKVTRDVLREYMTFLLERGKYTVVTDQATTIINHPDKRPDLGKPVSPTTVANYMRNIKVFFRFLKDERVIKVNPADRLKTPAPVKKERKLLSQQELRAFMRTFDTVSPYGLRSYIMVRLILDTGMRVGEIIMVTPDDVDLRQRTILVRHSKSQKERYVFFSQKMGRELRHWLDFRDRYEDCDYLFCSMRGGQLKTASFERTVKRHGEQAGLEVTPHLLRHNFARYYLQNGGDLATLSRILGHSSLETTKVYLDFSTEEIRNLYQNNSPLNNLKI